MSPPSSVSRTGEYAERGDYHRNPSTDWEFYPTYIAKLTAVRSYLAALPGDTRVLDAFLFQLMARRDPAWGAPLQQKIGEHAFSAIVLDRDPDTERGRDWYQSGFFGPGFIEAVKSNYREAGRSKTRVIYLPRE